MIFAMTKNIHEKEIVKLYYYVKVWFFMIMLVFIHFK